MKIRFLALSLAAMLVCGLFSPVYAQELTDSIIETFADTDNAEADDEIAVLSVAETSEEVVSAEEAAAEETANAEETSAEEIVNTEDTSAEETVNTEETSAEAGTVPETPAEEAVNTEESTNAEEVTTEAKEEEEEEDTTPDIEFYSAVDVPVTTAARVLSGIQVSWTACPNVRGYEVYRKADYESTYSKVATVLTCSWTDTKVESNMAYRYMVRAYRVESNGSVTKGSFSPSAQAGFIAQIKGVTLTNTSTGIIISWTGISGSRGYQVYRKAASESTYSQVATSFTTSWTDIKVSNNTSYTYMVRAYNKANDGSVYYGTFSAASSITFKLNVTVGKVTNLKTTRVLKGITVSWDAVAGVRGYEVYRKADNESTYSKVATSLSCSWTDNDVKSNMAYRYMVRAYVVSGSSTVKGDFCPSSQAGYILQVVGFSAENDGDGIKLTWNEIKGSRGYQVYRRSDKESTFKQVATSARTSWTDKDVVDGTKYTYMVRAYNKASDGYVYYGAFSIDITVEAGAKTLEEAFLQVIADMEARYGTAQYIIHPDSGMPRCNGVFFLDLVDMDHDGQPELVMANQGASVYAYIVRIYKYNNETHKAEPAYIEEVTFLMNHYNQAYISFYYYEDRACIVTGGLGSYCLRGFDDDGYFNILSRTSEEINKYTDPYEEISFPVNEILGDPRVIDVNIVYGFSSYTDVEELLRRVNATKTTLSEK